MSDAETPSIYEIIQLTRSELTIGQDDSIRGCGRAAVDLLPRDPEMCLQVAYQHLHDVPYREVKTCWRRLYTDAALHQVLETVEKRNEGNVEGKEERRHEDGNGDADWVTRVVKTLDMALILTGAPDREELIELWFAALKGVLKPDDGESVKERPVKRRKINADSGPPVSEKSVLEEFPTTIASAPGLHYAIPRVSNMSLEVFQSKVSKPGTQTPLIIEGAIEYWPAMDKRPWNSPQYLLDRTLGGRRLVPVEIGRSYTDQGWGQKIVSFGDFMRDYMLQEEGKKSIKQVAADATNGDSISDLNSKDTYETNNVPDTDSTNVRLESPNTTPATSKTGYLAQHDLFAQIPSLRADISIPDYCYCDPAPQTSNPSNIKPVPKLEEPLLNAWFGPAGTISPLHTDPYHNILAQVVGYKYVRLYAPDQTEKVYPRGTDENGVDMSNTSQVDLDQAMEVWEEISCWNHSEDNGLADIELDEGGREEYAVMYEKLKEAKYVEGVLGPGQCLYVPVGWWHYVRSLTPSFSVSFWFN